MLKTKTAHTSHVLQPKHIILSKPQISIILMQNFCVSWAVRKGALNTQTEIDTEK